MPIEMDEELRVIAEYMQANIRTEHLVAVAHALSDVAPILWSGYPQTAIRPLRLRPEEIKGYAGRTQQAAT